MSLAARPPILQPIPRQYATVTAMSLGMGMPSAARRAIGAGTSCGGMAMQASFSNRSVCPMDRGSRIRLCSSPANAEGQGRESAAERYYFILATESGLFGKQEIEIEDLLI